MSARKSRAAALYVMIVAVSVIVLAVSITFAWQRTTGSATPATSDSDQIGRPVSMLMIGDSFVGGAGDPSFPLYWTLVAQDMGWIGRIDAVGGSGYSPNTMRPPFISRIDQIKASFHPDVIIVDGGRNDLGLPATTVAPRIHQFLRALRDAFPKAAVVTVVPTYVTDLIPPNEPGIRDAIVAASKDISGYVIDPVAEGWFRGRDLKPLLWRDKIHPGAEGNRYYADRMVTALKALGLRLGQ
ncbi:SGNH/GDSL hydrolase family protein [Tsukamurella serpentis]